VCPAREDEVPIVPVILMLSLGLQDQELACVPDEIAEAIADLRRAA